MTTHKFNPVFSDRPRSIFPTMSALENRNLAMVWKLFLVLTVLFIQGCVATPSSSEMQAPTCDEFEALKMCKSGMVIADTQIALKKIIEISVAEPSARSAEILITALIWAQLSTADNVYEPLFSAALEALGGVEEENDQRFFLGQRLIEAAIYAGDISPVKKLLVRQRSLVGRRGNNDYWTELTFDVGRSVSQAEGYSIIASQYARIGDIETALEIYGQAESLREPQYRQHALGSARLHLLAKDYEGATADAENALETARKDKKSLLGARNVLLEVAIGAGHEVGDARTRYLAALKSEETDLSGHGSNFIWRARYLIALDVEFAHELFEIGVIISEQASTDFQDFLMAVAFECIEFSSERCLKVLTSRAELELSESDIYMYELVVEAYAALGQYEAAIRWVNKFPPEANAILPYKTIISNAIKNKDDVTAILWLNKWANDQTHFVPWSVHMWGVPNDKYLSMSELYVQLAKLHRDEGRIALARAAAQDAFVLAVEGSDWKQKAMESVTHTMGASLGGALGAIAANERVGRQ